MSKEIAETLRRALLLVDTPGKWCQNTAMRRPESSSQPFARCADTAIRAASYEESGPARIVFASAIGQIDIPSWNDKPERTHAEVVAAFERAIALAEAEE